MGNLQASQGNSALAQFYASNGADVNKALSLIRKSANAQIVNELCNLMGKTPAALLPPPQGVSGGAEGASESFIGGLDDMQNYGNSMYSKAKEKLIRAIAKDVFSALKMPTKNADTAPIEDVVAHLTKVIPPNIRNPRKFHPNFGKSASTQKHVIKVLADAINRHYSGALIDVNDDENAMAYKVGEIIYSLLQGLQTEFMNIAGDAMRVMNNMQIVQNYLDAAYKKQQELIANSGDPRIRDQSASTDEVYKAVKGEYERQSAILANLLNVSVGPTGKSLISSLEDSRDFTGLVKDLRTMVGTQAFGDKLSYLLSGISTAAHSAELIDKALKKIGMSVAEFKAAPTAGDLRAKVFRHIMNQSPSSKKLDDMMRAARIIYEANYDHNAVSKLLGKKGGAEGDEDDGENPTDTDPVDNEFGDAASDSSDHHDEAKLGGDDELPAYWKRKSLSKKIENKKKYRDLVLKDFKRSLRVHYQSIVNAANQIARRIGNGLPISDDLKLFVDLFAQLPSIDAENLHLALSGYPKDSENKQKREEFMNKFEVVLKVCETLSKGSEGQVFKSLGAAISNMIRELDNFSDKMVKALTEIHIDTPDEIAAALRKTSSTFYGSGPDDGGDELFGSGSWVSFDKIKSEMVYFFNIANVKSNLLRSHEDLKSYAEDYEQILGEEAAWLIDRIKRNYLAKIELITEESIVAGYVLQVPAGDKYSAEDIRQARLVHAALVASVGAGVLPGQPGNPVPIDHATKTNAQWALTNLKNIWNFQMNAKVNMVKVAQAVDMYLKAFTDGIAKNPDSISSVVKMLNEVEIVANWFNNRSGNNLASLFEVFPCAVDNGNHGGAHAGDCANVIYSDQANSVVVDNDNAIKLLIPDDMHYYVYLENRWGAAAGGVDPAKPSEPPRTHYNLPGNPFLGRPLFGNHTTPKQCKGIIMLSQKVVKSMRALENILSAFASVGAKLGDVDPLARTFMNPGQMFNALCDYVAASAFSTEFTPPSAAGNSAVNNNVTSLLYHGKITESKVVHSDGTQEQFIPTNDNADRYRGDDAPWSHSTAYLRNQDLNGGAALGGDIPHAHGECGIITGVSEDNAHAAQYWRKYGSIAMAAIPAETTGGFNQWKYHDAYKEEVRYDVAGWRDNFFDTDNLFQMTIKSIVAKIFTVVDAYRLFNRPVVDRRAQYSLNPLRTILGGADGGAVLTKVKVIPDALELYYRLILLAEWYRENFGVSTERLPNFNNWRVAIVPSIDGVWSEFVEVIFDKAEHVKEGNYTETQVQKLIVSMNEIWKLYKSKYPKATTRGILNAFVLEMNRAFGFLKQQEIQAYIDQRREMYKQSSADGNSEQFLDYDILNANDQFGARPAPSDKFARVSANESKRKERNMVFLQEAVEELRKRIDVEFLKETQNLQNDVPDSTSHFQETLKNYRVDMANAKSETDEYRVVLRMLQGANRKIQLSVDKLIMVHETVAAPLAVLYAVYKVLARFNSLIHGCSLVNLAAFNAVRPGVPGVPAAVSGQMNGVYESFAAYRTYIQHAYKDILDKHKPLYTAMFARAFTGTTNAAAEHGFKTANVAPNAPILANEIDGPELLENILSALLDFGSNPNKLVTVAVGGNGNINIDFATLDEICKDLLNQVKENINKLRLSFNPAEVPAILGKFEDLANIGSARWLEEHLVQILFNDRDKCGLPRAVTDHMHQTIAVLCVNDAGGAFAANNLPIGNQDARYGSMDRAMRSMLYYSLKRNNVTMRPNHYYVKATEFPGNVLALKREPVTQDDKKTVSEMDSASWTNAAFCQNANALMPIPLIGFTSNPNKYNFDLPDYTSLINTLNNVLHMYLYTNVDSGSNKFYLPLIEAFATSVASLEIVQGKAFPNIAMYNLPGLHDKTSPMNNIHNVAVGHDLPSPPDNTVIYASNALICKSLLTAQQSIGTMQKKKFAYESLADIPAHVRERMCVNLPFFSKIFNLITERAVLLKNMFTNMASLRANVMSSVLAEDGIRGTALAAGVFAAVAADRIPAGCSDLRTIIGVNSDQMAKYFDGLLTHLIECAGSLRKCADNVYKELQDKPSPFFETGKDFLQDYRSKNGGIPLMPVSSVLAPLRCLENDPATWSSVSNAYLALPVVENGSTVYKYNFATRLILAKQDLDVSLDHFPGAKEVYNAYSAGAPRNSMIAPSDYVKTITHMFKLAKFLMDGANYGRFFACAPRELNNMQLAYNSRSVFQAVNWRDAVGMDNDSADALSRFNVVAVPGNQDILREMAGGVALPPPHANDAYPRPYLQDMNGLNNKSLRIYPLANEISAVVELTEGTTMTTNKDNLALSMGVQVGGVSNDMRKRMRVLNILDAGIVPLNVHAFMREVPFVNLLNYSYTFDRMVHDFVMPSYIKNQVAARGNDLLPGDLMIKATDDINSTRELLVKLLVHPYADLGVDGKQYFALTASLFNGNDNLKLGRPRYLSDQLWHKVLLTSSAQIVAGQQQFNAMDRLGRNRYPDDLQPLESGPSAYEAVRAITRYSSKQLNKVQSIHTSGISRSDTTTRSAILNAFVEAAIASSGLNQVAVDARTLMLDDMKSAPVNNHIALRAPVPAEVAVTQVFTNSNLAGAFHKAKTVVNNAFGKLDSRDIAAVFIASLPDDAKHDSFRNMFVAVAANPSSMVTYARAIDAVRAAAAPPTAVALLAAVNAHLADGGVWIPLSNQYGTLLAAGGSSDVTAANMLGTQYHIDINRYGALGALAAAHVVDDGFCLVASATYNALINMNVSSPISLLLATALGQIAIDPLVSPAGAPPSVTMIGNISGIAAQIMPNAVDDSEAALGYDLRSSLSAAALAGNAIQNIIASLYRLSYNSLYGVGVRSLVKNIRASMERYRGTRASRADAPFAISSNPVAASGLKYWNGRTWTVANPAAGRPHNNMATGDVLYCAELGKMRFDTKLVRNLVWFVQTQRIMRVMLTSTLSWINTPVIRGLKIADSKVTEFNGNDQYTEDDFNGRNYDLL